MARQIDAGVQSTLSRCTFFLLCPPRPRPATHTFPYAMRQRFGFLALPLAVALLMLFGEHGGSVTAHARRPPMPGPTRASPALAGPHLPALATATQA